LRGGMNQRGGGPRGGGWNDVKVKDPSLYFDNPQGHNQGKIFLPRREGGWGKSHNIGEPGFWVGERPGGSTPLRGILHRGWARMARRDSQHSKKKSSGSTRAANLSPASCSGRTVKKGAAPTAGSGEKDIKSAKNRRVKRKEKRE